MNALKKIVKLLGYAVVGTVAIAAIVVIAPFAIGASLFEDEDNSNEDT